ncbi:MAG: HDOD domain-containing protein [Armatimonadetes bacterium]|nr:HDOD domain-containing protein [Armatimonadota bacterium]
MEAYAYGGREFPSLPVTDIPPLPEAALYALSVARRPGVSAGEVARALGSDEGIALRLLAIANSAYFATTQRITTLPHCVAWLGLDFVSSALVALGLDRLATDTASLDRRAFWQHNMAVATCCELLARRVSDLAPGEAYLVGLCHDLGKLVLAVTDGEAYGRCVDRAARTGASLFDVETETLGLDHALVGASAMREWNQSPELVFVVLNHHEEDIMRPDNKLLDVLMFAQGVCGTMLEDPGSPAAQLAEARRTAAMRHLHLDEESAAQVARETEESLEKLQSAVLCLAG